jgi:hypothetical protein
MDWLPIAWFPHFSREYAHDTPPRSITEQDGAGNSRRAFPFPGFGGLHIFFLSGMVAVSGCA